MAYQRKLNDGTTRWVVKWRDPDGKQLTRRFRTKTEATVFEGDLAKRRLQGESTPLDPKRTLAAFVEHDYWPRYALTHLQAKTREGYATDLRLRILPDLGAHRLTRLTRQLLDQYVAELATTHSPYTVHNTMTVLGSVLERAVEWSYTSANPAKGVRLPRKPKRMVVIPSEAQIRALAENAPTYRDRAMILTAAYSGLRQGELLALEWDDLELDDSRVHVRRSVDVDRTTKAPKTFRERSARLLKPGTKALRAWQAEAAPSRLVFPNERGAIIHRSNWNRRVWTPARTAAGLPTIRFHDLRHTYVSMLLRDGVDPVRVARWAGHSTPRMTWDVYAHVIDGE